MDYISREAAISEFETCGAVFVYGKKVCKAIVSRLNVIPAADVVEVVRCRDCAHCDDKTPYELWCLGRGWPNQMVPPDGFCDKGKRREAAR